VHSIPIVALTRGFPLAPFGWFGTRRPFPWLKGPSCDPEVRHRGPCRPTLFTKQVSPPVDGLDPPIVAAEVEQVERTRRKTWSRSRSEVFVPYRQDRMATYQHRSRPRDSATSSAA
jgi:hypothetical protein